jgi:formate/nitrite transporter FocA (FNT family)
MLSRARLTPTQTLICATVFVFTLVGAVLLAWAFRRWNGRTASEGIDDE